MTQLLTLDEIAIITPDPQPAPLINKSRYYVDTFGRDTRFRDVKSVLQDANRAAIQQTVCSAWRHSISTP